MTAADLATIGRRMGFERWAALRTFETFGGWIESVPEPEVKRLLGTQCPIFAWHAQLWQERIPAVGELTPESATRPPSPGGAAFIDAVQAPADTILRLTGAFRVLVAHHVAAHSAWRGATDPMVDAPTARVLDLIVRDELDAWRAGDAMLRSLIRTADDARRAAHHQGELEALLVSAREASPAGAAARGTATRS